jgi:hypothetical protein
MENESYNVTSVKSDVVVGHFWPEPLSVRIRAGISRAGSICRDAGIALVLSLVAAYGSYTLSERIDPVIFEYPTVNTWFDADIPRNFVDMNHRDSEYYTTHRHPLLPLIEFPPVYVLKRAFGFDPITAVRITVAAVASIWLASFFVVFRLLGCARSDAVLFSMVAITSAAAMFWLVVPETPLFGSLTILPAVALLGIAQRYPLSPLWYAFVSAVTFSVTVTNWMMGIAATIASYNWKRAFQITANAFCIVVVLWIVQKFLFPASVFFFGHSDVELPEKESGGPFFVLSSLLFHTMVAPAIKVTHWWLHPNLPVMTVQPSFPGSASIWGAVAALSWVILLGLGCWGLWCRRDFRQLRIFLGLSLVGQVALHVLYARETFTYSLHFVALLLVLASLSTFTRARRLALVLAGIVTVFGGINNSIQFAKATEFVRAQRTEAHLVRTAMKERPEDPWPRSNQHVLLARRGRVGENPPSALGAAHVVLARPGSPELDKAYHQPGGSFSPAVGSFGVSIWINDIEGNLKTTSDTIQLNSLHQQFVWTEPGAIPGIQTDSTYYRALWASAEDGSWLLTLKTPPNTAIKPMLAVRSVGPAGGPIHSLISDGQQLIVNHRWKLIVRPTPIAIYLGEEGPKGWLQERSDLMRWNGENGWGYARFELAGGQDYKLSVTDTTRAPAANKVISRSQADFSIQLPDDRFAASLHAQIAHLLMGLVGHEARPGDPMSYPLAWLRDQTYTTVALARAGQLNVAKELSKHLAENDFFGGFGAEADAPGLAIWALADVATYLKEPEYDQWLWPHIRRKAELILAMLSTDRPVHKQFLTPVIPLYTKPLGSADPDVTLVSDPSRNGLIMGRVDNFRPVLYVNAVSYRGLIDAAVLADRVDRPAIGREWRARAGELKRAWYAMLETGRHGDEWMYAHSLWPAMVADSKAAVFVNGLEARWANYARHGFGQSVNKDAFKVAEAHQWLLLGRGDRAWTTLSVFWEHQVSPGLYTWAITSGKENTSNRWEKIRGWLTARTRGEEDLPHDEVAPFYRTAAEILLLQLEMLAYVDERAAEPTLIIGAGIQPSWLDQPMSVRQLRTTVGLVDWAWDGRQMNVKIRGGHPHVRLGPLWASSTPIQIEYIDG